MTIKTDSYESLRKTLRRIIGTTSDTWVIEHDPDLVGFTATVGGPPDNRVSLSTTALISYRDDVSARVSTPTNLT